MRVYFQVPRIELLLWLVDPELDYADLTDLEA